MPPKTRFFASLLRFRASGSFVAAASLCAAASLAACGADGTQPYAGWDTLEDGDGVYRLRYLAPPWKREAVDAGDDSIALIVPPVFGSLDGGALPKYRLLAKLVPGLALPVLQGEIARISGARLLDAPAPYDTASVDHGFTAVLEDVARARYVRFVALAAPGDRALLVRLEMNQDPRNDREVEALMRAIDVRPFAE